MPFNAILRIFSVLLVTMIATHSSPSHFESIYFSFALSHYCMAFFYSKKQITQALTHQNFLPLAALVLFGTLMTRYNFPDIFFYFGLHHAITETYLMSSSKNLGARNWGPLVMSRFLINIFTYGIILRHDPLMRFLPAPVLACGFAASFFLFFYFLLRKQSPLLWPERMNQCLFEITGIGVILFSLFSNFTFTQVIFYHFVLWTFLPLPKIAGEGHRAVLRYSVSTIALMAVFFLLTPAGGNHFNMSQSQLDRQIVLWGYVHITASFALSSFNPQWIIKWFYISEQKP